MIGEAQSTKRSWLKILRSIQSKALGAIQIIHDTLGGRGELAKMSQDKFYW